MLERLELENFTAFDELDIRFSPGINVFIGQNGTGKTHILKILYAVIAALHGKEPTDRCVAISDKVNAVFMPREGNLGRLAKRKPGTTNAKIRITKKGKPATLSFHNREPKKLECSVRWDMPVRDSSIYIPVKEMLANAPGFSSLYKERMIHFSEVYADIIHKAFVPPKKGQPSGDRKKLLEIIRKIIVGRVISKGEQFYLKNKHGELEFDLLAEGMRKLGLLWLLIQNGSLLEGAKLFWDEPEANLNPSMIKTVAEILLSLQRSGVQIFVATHNYIVLKQFDLLKTSKDNVRFFELYRDPKTQNILHREGESYLEIVPNKISEAYTDIYDEEVRRSLGGLGN